MSALFHRVPRNAALLITLLVMIVVTPSVERESSWFIIELLFDFILIAGVLSVGAGKHRWPFIVVGVLTLSVRWGELLSRVQGVGRSEGVGVFASVITVIWISYAVWIIVGRLFRSRNVTMDTILGAIVTYLLAAVAFAMLFEIIEIRNPGSFSGLTDVSSEGRSGNSNALLYFSLVCITTMGFGDMVPVSSVARPLAVIEGVFGQLYLAVMIARLVGMHLAGERDSG